MERRNRKCEQSWWGHESRWHVFGYRNRSSVATDSTLTAPNHRTVHCNRLAIGVINSSQPETHFNLELFHETVSRNLFAKCSTASNSRSNPRVARTRVNHRCRHRSGSATNATGVFLHGIRENSLAMKITTWAVTIEPLFLDARRSFLEFRRCHRQQKGSLSSLKPGLRKLNIECGDSTRGYSDWTSGKEFTRSNRNRNAQERCGNRSAILACAFVLAVEQRFQFVLQIRCAPVFVGGVKGIHGRTVIISECGNET